jgi:hypothetical protein
MKRKIQNIVDKILTESLQQKADEMVNKIKSEMQESGWEGDEKTTLNPPKPKTPTKPGKPKEGTPYEPKHNPKPKAVNKIEELDIENMSDDEIYNAYCQKFGCDDNEEESEFDMDDQVTLDDFDSEEMDMDDEEEGFDWKYRQGRPNFSETETEEGNAFTGALSKAKEDGDSEFEVDGKKYNVRENKKDIKEKLYGKQNKLDKNKNGKIDDEDFKILKKSVKLSESEMIDLIEKLVVEEKEKSNIKKTMAKGEEVYGKAHKESGKENEDYIKSVTKKLKDYLKDGSKGEYETNPKIFPKGNGDLGKMDKKAYTPSNNAEEYIENFARINGMEDLDYDEIHPIDDWLTKNIEGSSVTGNNPEWANTGKSDTNKRLNDKRKKGLVKQLKRQAYNKSEQPVVSDSAGESQEKAKKSVNKIFKAMESEHERKERLIVEEISKMNRLLNYNQKTQ